MNPLLRSCARFAVVTLLLMAPTAVSGSAEAGCTTDDCDDLVSQFRQAYLINVYDDLDRLRGAVPNLVSQLRQAQPLTQQQLSQMTTQQIKNNAAVIQRQRDCLPRLIDLIREIRDRIDQLEGLAGTSVVPNRRGSARDRAIDDLLSAQEDMQDAVNDALRRAGIGG